MAGDWIKMRGNLWDDPRVSRLVDLTDSSEAAVIGGLYWLWATADQHTEDGVMLGLSLRQIDRKTGVQGLGQALVDIGWLADHPEGVRIINFEDHNGSSAKKRAQTARRVANHKAANADSRGEPDSGNAADDGNAESGNAQSVSTALPREREEKEKEKEKEHPPTPRKRGQGFDAAVIDLPDWLDRKDWESWVSDRKARKKPVTEEGAKRQLQQLAGYLAEGHQPCAVIANSIAGGYQGLFPPRPQARASPPSRAQASAAWNAELDQVLAEGRRRTEIDMGTIDATC